MTNVQAALEKAKAALKEHENNAEELQKAYQELLTASHKIAEIMYKDDKGNTGSQDNGSSDEPIEPEITK